MAARGVALVPGALALLPEYASLEDPVAELRAACLDVVASLGPRVRVVGGTTAGWRVGASLVAAAGGAVEPAIPTEGPTGVLVVGNGSARRSEKAPGHFDPRAEAYDDALRAALVAPDDAALRDLDVELAEELWADVRALRFAGGELTPVHRAEVAYDDAPYGVQYWVVRWVL